jgi:hypothetical protein
MVETLMQQKQTGALVKQNNRTNWVYHRRSQGLDKLQASPKNIGISFPIKHGGLSLE